MFERNLGEESGYCAYMVKKSVPGSTVQCFRCGRADHVADKCPFLTARCFRCQKTGHIRKVCKQQRKKSGTRKEGVDMVTVEDQEGGVEEEGEYLTCLQHLRVHALNKGTGKPIVCEVSVDGVNITMELDTGSAVSIVSEDVFSHRWPRQKLVDSALQLCTYSGEVLKVLGKWEAKVEHKGQVARLPVMVVKGSGPSLLGRNWLEQLKVDWAAVWNVVRSKEELVKSLVEEFKEVFKEGLGTVKGMKAKLVIKDGIVPKFCKARPVPYALKGQVEEELDRLTREGILEPVEMAEWAAPIVPVVKTDKKIRICGDFRLTINPALEVDRYPIPKIEDLLATLAGGKIFSKLDLSQAYQQVLLHEESKGLVCVNTHKGLFRYTRLPFGVASAPSIFQRLMETILQGIPKVIVYIDDILVSGHSEDEHRELLRRVLNRLQEVGIRLKLSKCSFMVDSVVYLGYKLDARGIHPVADKVKAVQEAPEPEGRPRRNRKQVEKYQAGFS